MANGRVVQRSLGFEEGDTRERMERLRRLGDLSCFNTPLIHKECVKEGMLMIVPPLPGQALCDTKLQPAESLSDVSLITLIFP